MKIVRKESKSVHDLSGLKKWLSQVLRAREPNVFELEQIYKHFAELGCRVEYQKGHRRYLKTEGRS